MINRNSLGVLNAVLNRERSLICKKLIICVLGLAHARSFRPACQPSIGLPQRLPAFSVVFFDSLRSLLRSCLRQSISLWSIVVNFDEFGFSALRKKQTLPRAGIHPHPDAFRRTVLAAMSTWRRGRGAESHAGGSAKWDQDRGGGRYR